MNVSSAFDNNQRVVNSDEEAIREARRRRDLFKDAFRPATHGSDCLRVPTEGIHDVDVVIIFDGDHHPTWGQPGASAEEALHYTRGKVNALLGASHGTFAKEVRLAKWRNHAVKCFSTTPRIPTPLQWMQGPPDAPKANCISPRRNPKLGCQLTRNA